MQGVRPWADIIQLEITSICNLRCVMCPLIRLKRDWAPEDRQLTLEDLKNNREVFENAYEVELTGFGEIFCHQELLNILRFLRETGCTINATTNAMLMKPELSEVIVRESLMDLICISIDAASQKTLAEIRVGANLDRIVENAKALQLAKKKLGADLPRLHLSFITMEKNLHELPDFIRLAGELGAAEVIVQGLNEVGTSEKNTASSETAESSIYSEARRIAEQNGVSLEFWYQATSESDAHLQTDGKTLRKYQHTSRPGQDQKMIKDCPFPWDRVFIKSNLDVQICATLWEELIMGNLRTSSFQEIWLGEKYRQARDQMRGTDPPAECVKCMTKHWRLPLPINSLSESIDFGDLYTGQLGLGFYPVERDENGRGHRWIKKQATFFLPSVDHQILELEIYFHPAAPPISGIISVNDQVVGRLDSRTHWRSPVRFALPDLKEQYLKVDLTFDHDWRAIDHDLPGGYRPVSAIVYAAGLTSITDSKESRLTAGGPGDDRFVEGWYDPESYFNCLARWSTKEASVILPGGSGSGVEIGWLNLPELPKRQVEVFVDHTPVHQFSTGGKAGRRKECFRIGNDRKRWQVLRLVMDDTWQPSANDQSADNRHLGLLVRSIGRCGSRFSLSWLGDLIRKR